MKRHLKDDFCGWGWGSWNVWLWPSIRSPFNYCMCSIPISSFSPLVHTCPRHGMHTYIHTLIHTSSVRFLFSSQNWMKFIPFTQTLWMFSTTGTITNWHSRNWARLVIWLIGVALRHLPMDYSVGYQMCKFTLLTVPSLLKYLQGLRAASQVWRFPVPLQAAEARSVGSPLHHHASSGQLPCLPWTGMRDSRPFDTQGLYGFV